jgi:cell division septation protein DedD
MNKSVSHYISELLFLHDCVIVPEFGGFVGNRKSAQLNKITGALTPPSKQILFNPNLKTNDGLLSSHIAGHEGISQEIALNNVLDYSTEKNNKLSTSKVLRLDKVGLFTLGKEGNVIFLQDSSTNYSLDAFGMQPTYNKTVSRKTETEKQVEATVQTIRTKSRNPKTLLRAAAVVIPLVALSYLSISQKERINNLYTQMATLNPFATNEIVTQAVDVITEKDLVIEVETEIIETPIIEEGETLVFTEQKTYYIIAGAFAEQKNANKMLNKLKRWDYNAGIVEGGNLLRVSYDSFTNREDAVLALNKIKQENSDAWLLTQ